MLKLRWGDVSLWARGALYARGSPARDGLGGAADFDAEGREVDRWLDLELRWSRTLSPRLRVMARAYFDLYDYLWSAQSSSWAGYGSGSAPPEGVDAADFTFLNRMNGASHWGGFEAQGSWDWLGDGRFPLMVGVDTRLRHFESVSSWESEGVVFETNNAYGASEWQVAVYAQQRARFHPKLQLNLGARLDTQSAFLPRVSPRAALVWTAPWEGRFKLVFNSAFRTPTGYERFVEYPDYQVRNPGLRPESVLTGELGYEQRIGRHRFFAGAFVSQFTDMVRFLETPEGAGLYWYENQGSLLNVGGHVLMEGTVGQLGYGASFTGAVNQSGEEPLVASPGWFGNARLSWNFGEGLPRASLVGSFSGSRLITMAGATGLDAAGEVVEWDASRRSVGPQVELRATVDASLKAVPGLWVRGVVGGSLTPFSAYTVGPRLAPEAGFTTPAQAPNSRLFVLLTLGWSLDSP